MSDKITAIITSDVDCWERWRNNQKACNKSYIVVDNKNSIEFSDGEKHIRIDVDKIQEQSLGYGFDDVRYMKDIITYKDIKIGMLLVRDLDGFMLGNRWLVTEKRENGSFYAHHYHYGISNEYFMSDLIIPNDPNREYWYQIGETLEHWQKKFMKVNGKIVL